MNISSPKFITSCAKVAQAPDLKLPEYAFIGRSNVGKSSLINMLCNQKGLAKVSSTPGKTQLLNFFDIDGRWTLVDLPGYGYAKVPLGEKAKFLSLITDYALKRSQLTMFFVLVDVRHAPQTVDKNFMEFLGINHIPFAIIFTKADKLKPAEVETKVAAYKQEMLKSWETLPPTFVTSSPKGEGKELLLAYIDRVNTRVAAQNK